MQFSLFDEPSASQIIAPATTIARATKPVRAKLPKPKIKPPIEWSYSKRDLFERCLLWYYYNHYGALKTRAKLEPLKNELQFLKQLSNFNLRAGDILHIVIGAYLKKAKNGEVWTLDRLLSWAKAIYEQDKIFSVNYRRGDVLPEGLSAPVLLVEFFYDLPDASQNWQRSFDRLQVALTNFITNPKFEGFRAGALYEDSLIERPVRVTEANFKMRGKLDLAYPQDERHKIIDWKIGESSGESSDSLQMLAYAFAAVNELRRPADSIDLYKVYLQDSVVSVYSPNESDVQKARAFIIQDTERLMKMDDYGIAGNVAAFTPCEQLRVCRMCPFSSVCPTQKRGAINNAGN